MTFESDAGPQQPSGTDRGGSELALFDFDGTITRKDSLADFAQYAVGKTRYWLGLIVMSPVLVAYKLGFVKNHEAKRRLLAHYFAGWDFARFQAVARRYSSERLNGITRAAAMVAIAAHKADGHRVVIVSASMESWLRGWCDAHSLELVSTRLEVIDGKLTGQFATPNCHGEEKVRRIRDEYDVDAFDVVHAYGDSRGDKEMLAMADRSYYRHFP